MQAIQDFIPTSKVVPSGVNAANWDALEPLYRELVNRPVTSAHDLEDLIRDRSDVDAAAAEAASMLYINMTCHTDNAAHNKAYLDHIQNVQPNLKDVGFELDKKITASPFVSQLDSKRYHVYLRNMQAGVELFRPENVALETQIAELDQEYSQICGAMTVMFRGEERTIPQMSPHQENTDRAVREEAWRLVAERRRQDKDRIGDIFDQMVKLRHQIALNAGFANFRDFMFKAKRRFEYTPADCDQFALGVEQVCVPAMRRLHAERAKSLGIPKLRPWDLHVDVKGRSALKPFFTADEMVQRTSRLFHRMEPSLGQMFDTLRSGGCLDLESRKGKAPGGYQANRDWIRKPFIFMNAAGIQRDVETIIHEAGHAFHALLSRHDPLLAYRADIPLEFAEVASMGMELTAHPFLDEFYPKETAASNGEASRAQRVHLESITTLLPVVAAVDQFQHWMYTNPNHTRAEREAYWVTLNDRFGGSVDWTGMEDLLAISWHRILHLFGVPFYFIEYGIAQLGAVQLWLNYLNNPSKAIASYISALTEGGSLPIPDLYTAAGLRFEMGPAIITRLWTAIEGELKKLPA
ncbi:MAG: M3 family oligoendopeptidase [Pyrinomonadaceae bacterium]|nr:M3 family oligoendopeptidase [Phycisphaerales bacterium]